MKRISRKKGIGVLFVVVLAAVAVFCAAATAGAAEKQVLKLKYGNLYPPVHPFSKLTEEWIKDVEKKTNGRVTFSYFPGSTLTPPMQAYDAVVKGIADCAQYLLAYAPGRLPLSEVLQQPLGYANGYQATMLANAYYKKFKPKEFDDVKVMYLHGAAPGYIHLRKEATSMADVKGMRIKANAENADIVKNLGGAPVTQPITETYDSLSKGLLDGVLLPIEALQGWKLGEVLKTTLVNLGTSYMTSLYVIMNKEKWNSISPTDRKAIERINAEYAVKFGKKWVELDKRAETWAMGKGMKFVQVSKEEVADTIVKMKPILGDYVKKMYLKGLPGEQALKFAQDYIKKHP
jgi:TRAP-type C4-dicarboxylate transport system substrate-binding protein